MVTGAIAVMMKKSSILLIYPERVLSIIMASTQRINEYATDSGFNDKVGTGMLNLANALDALDSSVSISVKSDSKGTYVETLNVYLKKGNRIIIAFVSLVNNGGNNNTSLVTDYDLYLFDSSSNFVGYSIGSHNNEFIDYFVETSGTYTIKIKQFGDKQTNNIDFCAYTYFII